MYKEPSIGAVWATFWRCPI